MTTTFDHEELRRLLYQTLETTLRAITVHDAALACATRDELADAWRANGRCASRGQSADKKRASP